MSTISGDVWAICSIVTVERYVRFSRFHPMYETIIFFSNR